MKKYFTAAVLFGALATTPVLAQQNQSQGQQASQSNGQTRQHVIFGAAHPAGMNFKHEKPIFLQ